MKRSRTVKPKFPRRGSLDWDYGARMAAAQSLIPPNKAICIYCLAQARTNDGIVHHPECPVPVEDK